MVGVGCVTKVKTTAVHTLLALDTYDTYALDTYAENYFMCLYNVKLTIIFLPGGEVQRIRVFFFPRRGWENSLSWL